MSGAGPGGLGPLQGPLEGLPAAGKLASLVAFVIVVVATPARWWPAFIGYATLLAGVALFGRLSLSKILRRSVIEVPFLLFAALMPLVGSGPRIEILGVSLSQAGLVGGATLAVKATLGVVGAVILALTTPPRELLAGLERLRLPSLLVAILSFMVRYAHVLTADLSRMRLARMARGASGSAAGQLGAVAATVGTVFVRSYERGERVHQAMVARGYDGVMPSFQPVDAHSGRIRGPLACAVLPAAAVTVLALVGLVSG